MAAARGIHPGKPNAVNQAMSSAYWNEIRLVAYVSGNNLLILSQPGLLRQTIYLDRDGGAIEIEESSGLIAVVSGPKVLIFRPSDDIRSLIQWSLAYTIHLDLDDGIPNGVNWGSDIELFIAGKTISLWALFKDGPSRLWRKRLAIPAALSAFSFDAFLAATVGKNDKLVKVWRRFSYDLSNVDFDFSYLAHPRAVTGLRWRKPFAKSQTIDNILYTLSADGVLRIWAPTETIESSYMQMWASLDLFDVLPQMAPDELRYTFIIDNKDFTRATESAVRNANSQTQSSSKMKYLIEVASKNPDVCIVFDQHGRMTALGIENIGSRVRKAFSIFDITYESKPIRHFPANCQHLGFVGFGAGNSSEPDFSLLVHDYSGVIRHFETSFADLLYNGEVPSRFILKHAWTGHYKSIQSFIRTADGKALLSSSNHAENIIWVPRPRFGTIMLQPKSIIMAPDKVQRAIILLSGNFVVTMQSENIVLWDCRSAKSTRIAISPLGPLIKKTCLSFLLLPESETRDPVFHVLAIYSDQQGIAWEVHVPYEPPKSDEFPTAYANGAAIISKSPELGFGVGNGFTNGNGIGKELAKQVYHHASLKQLGSFEFPLPEGDTLASVLPVDPVGWTATLSGSIDTYARDVVTTISKEGVVRSWTAKLLSSSDQTSLVQWLQTAKVNTRIRDLDLAKSSTMKKISVVDSNSQRLTIWDINERHLEYEESFDSSDGIRDLDWTCTPDSQSILAVGFTNRIKLYCQLRYDYTKELPAWAAFREVSIRQFTPRDIGDSIWLDDGTLVIGSGNQLFTQDKKVDTNGAIKLLHLQSHKLPLRNIFEIVSVLNGPLPIYHPQLIAQSVFGGKSDPVRNVFVNLLKALKFSVPSDTNVADVESNLGMDLDEFIKPSEEEANKTSRIVQNRADRYAKLFATEQYDDGDYTSFSDKVAIALNEYLTKLSLPYLTSHQQISLAAMIEAMGQVEEYRTSLDENGIRYFLSFRLFILHRDSMLEMPYRDHNWAFHSGSQEILVDLVSRSFNGRMTWTQARESGIFMWLKSHDALRQQFESVARIIYTDSEPRNPVDCTLFYIALKKKQVLLGLWRMASYHKEQQMMMKFLANNFAEPRWRTAALKNAYVLLSKQRYEYAAAFFLLGESLKDAVSVCVRNLNDIQLAVAVARIYEGGDDGPVFKSLLQDEILPLAFKLGDKWLASWAFWNLGRQDLAVKSIITSVKHDLPLKRIRLDDQTELDRRMFTVEDPVLVVLYRQLRDSLQESRKVGITPQMETQFVLHIAKLYDRMGCDILALDLTTNWKFIDKVDNPVEKIEASVPSAPKSMLDMWG
ncbi:RAVE protein 1 C terminal-domain-containing protein [Lipomyces oligophaga]|uniref:RAVE protein 1 C terminal-domain-containing protein n=1 Tax=Lipomyces oligophaga TaxID=45792 RepID=UPI0034CE94F0